MATERTLSIIKPDATKRNLTGKINAKFEEAGLRVVAQKRIHLSPAQAGAFYAEHAERGFSGAVAAHKADLVAGGNGGRGPLEQGAAFDGIGDVGDLEHGRGDA